MPAKAKPKYCKNCGEKFPIGRVLIDGKMRDLWPRKYCLNCSPFGARNNKQLEKVRTDGLKNCKGCNSDLPREAFQRGSLYCRPCLNAIVRKRSIVKKAKMVAYLGGKCKNCGYDRCLAALDFHHVSDDKEFEISRHKWKSLEEIRDELDKCVVLCRICHAEHHASEELNFVWKELLL